MIRQGSTCCHFHIGPGSCTVRLRTRNTRTYISCRVYNCKQKHHTRRYASIVSQGLTAVESRWAAGAIRWRRPQQHTPVCATWARVGHTCITEVPSPASDLRCLHSGIPTTGTEITLRHRHRVWGHGRAVHGCVATRSRLGGSLCNTRWGQLCMATHHILNMLKTGTT